MRRVCLAAVACLALIVGCASSPRFLEGVDATWQVVGPQYRAYVAADETLSASSREIRLLAAETMDLLIEEERARWAP